MTNVDSPPGAAELTSLAALADRSLEIILALQDSSGAYPASPSFSAYRGYSWFRDGAFIADGVSAYGAVDSASRFFDWCSGILLARREQIDRVVSAAAAGTPVTDAEMLPTRFTFSGDAGADDWWDFQLDGYGTWLWAVAAHAKRHQLSLDTWRTAIELTADYLVSSWSRPCFDWWEEHTDEVHVSTLGCVLAGLSAIAETGLLDGDREARVLSTVDEIAALIATEGTSKGHLSKWLGSSEVDASLLALVGLMDVEPASGAVGSATVAVIDQALNSGGGVHRYLDDTFYGGGQWPLLSCMLGLAFARQGDTGRALDQLRWVAATATEVGELPEQVALHLLDPGMRQEWVDRWGGVATPLLWSHAMYLRLAVELGIGAGAQR